jgi:para-nitrobenzyl esterase
MSSAWASFAADGVPADWPEYGVGRRATLVFADEVEVVDDPGAEARRAWLGDNL